MLLKTTITGLSGGMGFFRDAEGRSVAFRVAAVVTGRDRKYGSYETGFRDPQIGAGVYYDPKRIQKGPKGLFCPEVFSDLFGRQLLAEEAAKAAREATNLARVEAEKVKATREDEEVQALLANHSGELREFTLPEPTAELMAAYQAAIDRSTTYQVAIEALGACPEFPTQGDAGVRVTFRWREFNGLYEAYRAFETRQERATGSYGGDTFETGGHVDVRREVVRWTLVSGDDIEAAYRAARQALQDVEGGVHYPQHHPAHTEEHREVRQAYRKQFAERLGVPLWILARALRQLGVTF